MAEPFLKVKDTDELITDLIWGYTYWNMPWGKVGLTPISGGFYPQNTTAGTLRFGQRSGSVRTIRPLLWITTSASSSSRGRMPQTVYRFRDLQGFTRDVHIAASPFGTEADGVQGIRDDRFLIEDLLSIEVQFVVPGYLPAELGS